MKDLSKHDLLDTTLATHEWVSDAGGSFEFVQVAPASDWVINHPLGRYPTVTVIVGSEEVEADVHYNSVNQVTVHFVSPQSGRSELT